MKKIALSIFTFSLFISCGDSPLKEENSKGQNSEIITDVKINETEGPVANDVYKIPDNLFNDNNKSYILKNADYEMFNAGGPDDIWVKPIAFKPEGWENNFIYAQLDFTKGEVTSTAFVIFYPQVDGVLDDNGEISSEVYQVIDVENQPCSVCIIESITVEVPQDYEFQVIKGVFIDRIDSSKKIIKYMDYNLPEMDIFWNDVYNYDDLVIDESMSKYNKKKYSKEDVVGHWFQPHFAVRTLDFKNNGEVLFNDGSVENEDIFFNGKWEIGSNKTSLSIVFEKGINKDLKMPLNLSGGLEKSSFMLSNGKENFAKNYE